MIFAFPDAHSKSGFAATLGVCSIELLCCAPKSTKEDAESEDPISSTFNDYEAIMSSYFEQMQSALQPK
jgi:hypothetical protein